MLQYSAPPPNRNLPMASAQPWPLADSWQVNDGQRSAKSTRILHNTIKPFTRQAAVEHEAWARGTRGAGPGSQNQGARTKQ